MEITALAGHNKWSKIKHRKAVVDKRRGKVWTKVSKAIIVAAKNGGGDPTTNLSLRYAIDEARYANMPRDTIERAIKKGAGAGEGENYEAIRYEGYAPGGVAIIVDSLTDNRTRTVNDVRLVFSDYDGNLGASGCVAYLFHHRGQIFVSGDGLTDDAAMDLAIEAGALDVIMPGDEPSGEDEPRVYTILTDPTQFTVVKERLVKAGLKIEESLLTMLPENTVAVSGEQAKSVAAIIEGLEDLDDVQKVYTNAELPDEPA